MELIGRNNWSPGPWDTEPDRVEWVSGGYYCQCNRNRQGSWCGYVGVPNGHKWYGLGYDEIHNREPELSVHGGLTFASAPRDDGWFPPDLWVVGFDCAHSGDLSPGIDALLRTNATRHSHPYDEVYRDLAYTQAEVGQLVAHANGGAPFSMPILLRVENADEVRIGPSPGHVVVGDGAMMLRDFIRGNGFIGAALDWLDDYPNAVQGMESEEFAKVMERLRFLYQATEAN